MKFRKYTKEQLIEAVATSTSIRQTLLKLNVVPYGGNYQVFKGYIKLLNLDTSHFRGQGWSINKKFTPKRNIQEYLTNKFPIQSNKLRKRLLQEKIFEHKCSICGNTTWLNLPIPLELEHKDGNHDNNLLINLCLICPNCHAQTPTYRGKNIPFKIGSVLTLQKCSPN